MGNYNDVHKRDEFDKSLRMIINKPDHFVDMFSQIIKDTETSPRNVNVMNKYGHMGKEDIRNFYENSSVGEYEKATDTLGSIMTDENENSLIVLIAALDIKMVEKMDKEAEFKKDMSRDFNDIPEPVEDDIPSMVMENETSFGF